MKKFWDSGVWVPVFVLLVVVPLLGVSARSRPAGLALTRAQAAAEAKNYLVAARYTAQAAGQMPVRPDLWEKAGRYALQGGEAGAAIEYFERAAPDHLTPQGWVDLGWAYRQSGDRHAALAAWQVAAQLEPPGPELHRFLYEGYLEIEDFPAAAGHLQALLELQPGDARTHYQLGLLSAARQPEEALTYLEGAAELDPTLEPAVTTLTDAIQDALEVDNPAYRLLESGRALAVLEEWSLAAEAFRQSTRLQEDYSEAWAYLGEALQHLPGEQGDRGLAELNKALALNPDSLPAQLFLSQYWARQSKYDQALEALKAATLQDPSNPLLVVEMGRIQALSGDLEAALAHYQRAVAMVPRDSLYLRYLSEFSLRYRMDIEGVALPAARQAVMLSPNDPANLDLMGQVLSSLEDEVNAERFLRRAIQAGPDYAPARLHLGALYLLQGKTEAGQQELEQAVALDPNGPAGDQAQRLMKSFLP